MPSFDIVSKIDKHELTNAVDQANREITNRFDFKDSNAIFELAGEKITAKAPNEFQLKQMKDVLLAKMAKRQIALEALNFKDPETNLHESKQIIEIKQGIDGETAKKISRFIKDGKSKVQASIQGDQVRVTGKKRDDLQDVIAELRAGSFGLPLQFENFRD